MISSTTASDASIRAMLPHPCGGSPYRCTGNNRLLPADPQAMRIGAMYDIGSARAYYRMGIGRASQTGQTSCTRCGTASPRGPTAAPPTSWHTPASTGTPVRVI
jgi:hypothetical protein